MGRDAQKRLTSATEGLQSESTTPSVPSLAFERHFSVAEVANMWNLSPDAVRRLFRNEPGVLILGEANPRAKRRYLTIRIPQSVLERVHRHFIIAFLIHK